MKASVQLPPYKGEAGPLATSSPSVHTMVEHFNDETRRTGTKTVTRTITPTGEMAVYASQSSVRFKMTSKSSSGSRGRQELSEAGSVTLPRPRYERSEERDGARDLYPVTVTTNRRQSAPPRSLSLRDTGEQSRQSLLASPDFNILHRDTGQELRAESQSAPQQGYSVVVAIDFGELHLILLLLHQMIVVCCEQEQRLVGTPTASLQTRTTFNS